MRLWSVHPKYLDSKGIVALWREGLLARKVLAGKTKGYRNHPQLGRFKQESNPLRSIDVYLEEVLTESLARGYSFDASKIRIGLKVKTVSVTRDQLAYEWKHLLSKLEVRDQTRYCDLKDVKRVRAHPLFKVVKGPIASWEKTI